jgi:hypothetical protein
LHDKYMKFLTERAARLKTPCWADDGEGRRNILMISPVSAATQMAEVSSASQAAAAPAAQKATLPQDTVSISPQGQAAVAHDGDGDGH